MHEGSYNQLINKLVNLKSMEDIEKENIQKDSTQKSKTNILRNIT